MVLDVVFMTKNQYHASSSKAFRVNEYIKPFWQKKQESNCRFKAMLCLWLGRFTFCDSKDTFSLQVIPWAMVIAYGHVVPLTSLFLGLLYQELDQLYSLEEQVIGRHIKRLEITPYPFGIAKSHYVIDSSSYLPKKLLLACCWFRKIMPKKQDFLELLDDVNIFFFFFSIHTYPSPKVLPLLCFLLMLFVVRNQV
ncbi:hypothetical protein D8674_037782 [Pyrus ussuriensis x Pyrus communis]|uniref:Aminotransferase-like plant mobile domain-containing protein n=1 Tax=Pyrus ussuriensis x Pyrus communis TaxID=2448454 RepID=A0A5N5FMH5_9ROSA|nr:hypothetical protein D8674_037782 [Pyrus ussuriensis x Pyrus communis]